MLAVKVINIIIIICIFFFLKFILIFREWINRFQGFSVFDFIFVWNFGAFCRDVKSSFPIFIRPRLQFRLLLKARFFNFLF